MISRKDGFQGERAVVLPPVIVETEEQDDFCEGLFITDIGYYPKAEHHHRVREEGVNQYVLIYCVDGSGFYVVDGKRYEVGRNQYFILPIGKPHEYGATEGHHWTIYWVHFRGKAAHVFAEGAATPQSINVTMQSRISERINIFEEILTTLHLGDGIEDLRYASSLLAHFLASMRYLEQFRRAKTEEERDIVEQAIHYMRENIEQHITMDEVLRYVGYSQSHFSTVFKKKTGVSPITYINRLKIEHACRLLRTTDMKVNQICYKVGIEDALYFSRLFSKIMNMSPTDYRLRERQ
ncbi:MAG: AraC family transcriptional regulator [Bacteroidaceae bacterium]|nr:AraC family transcriptional regulator [Bacteroidaceae bacterium]